MVDEQETAYATLGRAVLDELLTRAGLDQARAPSGAAVAVALQFTLQAHEHPPALTISSERIGQPALELRIDLE